MTGPHQKGGPADPVWIRGSDVALNAIIPGTVNVAVPGGVAINGQPIGVNVNNTPNVAVPGGVAITGTPNVAVPGGVAITGTPNVAIPGGVAITGTPNVAIPGGVVVSGAVITHSSEIDDLNAGLKYYSRDEIDLTNGQVYDLQLTTPASPDIQMTCTWAVEDEAHVILYEGATSTVGTAISSFNRNRQAGDLATALLVHTPTITVIGTEIAHYHMGKAKAQGGSSGGVNKRILKANTKYVFRITNDTTSANWFVWLIEWVEKDV